MTTWRRELIAAQTIRLTRCVVSGATVRDCLHEEQAPRADNQSMIKVMSLVGAVAALVVSVLAGVLGVVSLATGELGLTAALVATALAAVWIAARVPIGQAR